MPFSDWSTTVTPVGTKFGTRVGSPMPRFTYEPSSSSAAARAAIWSRVSAMSGSFRGDGASLDALGDVGSDLDDAVHVHAGQVDPVRVELARFNEALDLRDADPARHR